MKRVTLITLLLLAFAAKAQEVKTLTLKDALTYALENKSDAKKAKLDIENSEYQITEVRSRALPQISANGNTTYNPILQLNALPGDFFGAPGTTILAPLGQKWTSSAGVSLTQTIFDQAVFIGLKAAKTTREFYQVNAQLTEEQVIERVANNYYQVYVKRQNLNVLDSNYVNTEKVRNIIKGQFDNGLAKKIDLDRIVVKLSNINTMRQQALNDVQLQENALKFYMGMPIETKIVIPQTEFEVTPTALAEKPNTSLRTEYKLLETQEKLLTYQKKSIVAEYYPTLSISGSYNYLGQGPELPLFAKPEDGVYWSDFATIGLSLKIPIFTGFSTKSRVQQADIKIRSLKEDMTDTKLSLDLAYENSRTQIDNSIITIKNQKENVQLAEEVLSNTRNNYTQGLAPLTDVLDSENALTEAQNNYTSALLDYRLAEIQLVKSQGALKTLLN
ncbi:transporter [Flavobacterium noncentrifugens]|uniref:Outer membrane protein TolC n=1 Tax=Flavobacterium noncentrifugens TaxID=1128970 RepID=A0A1G9AJ02_9FLAO|nr:TolC family protein [Flavobacterium noncentrifugens]GEP51468.1 transporter [Flavobacterium noncentrifugens]SDK27261.1 Outer membrane protein TolC [Flavobacterium noncentrifugens]